MSDLKALVHVVPTDIIFMRIADDILKQPQVCNNYIRSYLRTYFRNPFIQKFIQP